MAITPYTGTFPNRISAGDNEAYATDVYNYLNYIDGVFVTTVNNTEANINAKEASVVVKEATVVAKEALMNPHYTAIDVVYANIADIDSIVSDIIPNLPEILMADTNAATATTKAAEAEAAVNLAMGTVNYKGDWVAGYQTTGYSLGMSISYTDGFNYVSKINNNLVEPTAQTNTAEWNWVEAINPATKQDTLISGTNIKTVNGVNILGGGNATVADTSKLPLAGGTMTGTLTLSGDGTNALHAVTKQQLDAKQNTLVSGTNIKTVGGSSILGSGDLEISTLQGLGNYSLDAMSDGEYIVIPFKENMFITCSYLEGNVYLNSVEQDGSIRTKSSLSVFGGNKLLSCVSDGNWTIFCSTNDSRLYKFVVNPDTFVLSNAGFVTAPYPLSHIIVSSDTTKLYGVSQSTNVSMCMIDTGTFTTFTTFAGAHPTVTTSSNTTIHQLSTSNIMIVYPDTNFKVVVATISNGAISYGTPLDTSVSASAGSCLKVAPLGNNKFLLFGDTNTARIRVIQVSGTTVALLLSTNLTLAVDRVSVYTFVGSSYSFIGKNTLHVTESGKIIVMLGVGTSSNTGAKVLIGLLSFNDITNTFSYEAMLPNVSFMHQPQPLQGRAAYTYLPSGVLLYTDLYINPSFTASTYMRQLSIFKIKGA